MYLSSLPSTHRHLEQPFFPAMITPSLHQLLSSSRRSENPVTTKRMKTNRPSSIDTKQLITDILNPRCITPNTLEDQLQSHQHDQPCFPDSDHYSPQFSLGSCATLSPKHVPSNGQFLGSGKFGQVQLHQVDSSLVAIKIVKRSKGDLLLTKREVEIQTRLAHEHIAPCLGYFGTPENHYIITEYAPCGSLSSHPIRNYKVVLRQVASALDHLRWCRVAHRDIKTENLLVHSKDRIKLTDFGWAVHCPPGDERRMTLAGSPHALAPEQVRSKSGYNALFVDVWALGILAHELVLHRDLFISETRQGIMDDVHDFVRLEKNGIRDKILYDFLASLLMKNPRCRITPKQALEHEWLNSNLDRKDVTTMKSKPRKRRRSTR